MKTLNPTEEMFTLPLKRFLLRYVLGSIVDKVKVDPVDAIIIAEKDKEEKYVHIQFTDFNGTELAEPYVWHIKEWKTANLKWLLDKERSERERKEACINEENAQLLVKSMVKETGLTDVEMRQVFYRLAKKNVSRKDEKIEETFKVKFDKG